MPSDPKNTISKFLTNFYGGTRLNRFQVTSSNCKYDETNKLIDDDTKFHIRAAAIPGSNITPLGINWFGRTIPLPGERVYDPWKITIIDDRGTRDLYSKFKAWQKKVVDWSDNIAVNTSDIKDCKWTITHYSNNNTVSYKEFNLYQCWPVNVGPLVLDMSQDNVLSTFEVTMHYTHFDFTHK